jgi:single-strand DNA-binding protein
MEWHRVVGFGDIAKTILRVVKKGHLVEVQGRLSTRSYVDRHGVKQTSTSIIATNVTQHELPVESDPEAFSEKPPKRAAQ